MELSFKQLGDGFLRVGQAFQGFFKGEYGQWAIAIAYVRSIPLDGEVAVPKMTIPDKFRVVPASSCK